MKNIILALVVLFLFLPCEGHAEEKGKSEIMALVGMRIPPAVPYMKQAKIPGWRNFSAFHLPSHETGLAIGGEEGHTENEGGFVLIHVEKDMTRIVLDARVLPLNLLTYYLKDGKHFWYKDAIKRYIAARCEKTGTEDAVVGLMRPEPGKEGCLHYSRQVKMAWRVNEKTRKLEEISPEGVVCYFGEAEDECLNK